MFLTTLFWTCSCLPGYALARRLWPSVHQAGFLSVIAWSALGTFLVLSPVSIACYALAAPLWVFSAASVVAAAVGLAVLVRARAGGELLACVRRESVAGWLALLALLWLQARIGGYFSGDATFHVGRIRVLLEHGFTNRDIYLSDYFFQHIYHTNLLYPIYASLTQLTGQTYLEAWFYSQAWTKLLVAAGHYVLGYGVTRRRLAAWLLALTVITANAGETYTVYPNTLAVGWLVPMLLGAGYSLFAGEPRRGAVIAVAVCSFVLGQVHSLYALYAGMAIGPALGVALSWPKLGGRRVRIGLALLGTLGGAPFLLVSHFGLPVYAAASAPAVADDNGNTPPAPVAPSVSLPPVGKTLPDVNKGKPAVPTPAVAAGGGHLEKSLELDRETARVWFEPRNMGGPYFVAFGCAGFLLAFACSRERRGPLAAAALSTTCFAVTLFVPRVATLALEFLDQPFTVARLSTILSSLLLLGMCAAVAELVGPFDVMSRLGKWRWAPAALVLWLATAAATRLTGHAPLFFSEVVAQALAPAAVRHATLDMLEQRRHLLAKVIPPGTTVLATARFARSVVMICDCYVIIADRGHTRVSFARDRRYDVRVMNAAATPWEDRSKLLQRYSIKLVVFESRHVRRLYRWTDAHGRVIGEAAGLRVVELREG